MQIGKSWECREVAKIGDGRRKEAAREEGLHYCVKEEWVAGAYVDDGELVWSVAFVEADGRRHKGQVVTIPTEE